MSLFQSLRNTVQSWVRRRGKTKPPRSRANVALERLDHRQLLSVTFTGNATTDIPDNAGPGFAIVQNPTPLPINDPQLAALIKVSGFDISAVRMFYSPQDDILSIAIQQPLNQKTNPQFPVIAGDADNNGNGGTVDPAVLQVQPLFQDYPYLGGTETMGVFLDLNNDSIPDVVAGISNDQGAGKLYQVADAVVNPDPNLASTTPPAFGTPLQDNTGFAFLRNADPTKPSFEFQITNFSKLYQAKTGKALQANSVIRVGAFGGSNEDFINEEFVPAQPVSFGVAPPPPPTCPPLSPPVMINPHQHRHVNTAHPTLIRVNLFGTSGFNVNQIDPQSVRLGGAAPLAHFTRNINHDEFLDATYIFQGDQIQLPRGIVEAHVTGTVTDPATGHTTPFDTAKIIFNRDKSYYSPAQQAAQAHRQQIRGDAPAFPPPFLARRAHQAGVDLVIDQMQNESTISWRTPNAPTVAIATRSQNHQQRLDAIRSKIHPHKGPLEQVASQPTPILRPRVSTKVVPQTDRSTPAVTRNLPRPTPRPTRRVSPTPAVINVDQLVASSSLSR